MSEQVRLLCIDAGSLPESTFDIAFAFECAHDMPRPVEVLPIDGLADMHRGS